MIDQFYTAMSAGKANDILLDLLNGLVEYTIVHFKTEEELMDRYHYSLSINHKFKHTELTKQVKEYQQKALQGNMLLSIELGKFLKTWLTDHILKTDKDFGKFLQEKGLQ